MGRSAIISVGDELLGGRITDTNATFLSRELRLAGFPVARRETVGDDPAVIADAVTRCGASVDVVVISGGLGPTPDDLTREGLARAMGVTCTRSAEAEEHLRIFFDRAQRKIHESNLVQCDLPEGASSLMNDQGSAPGVRATVGRAEVFVLPGVPRELKAMTAVHLLPFLADHAARGPAPHKAAVTVCGVPESEAGRKLRDLMRRGRNPSIGSYPGVAHLVISIEAVDGDDGTPAAELARRDVDEIVARLGEGVLATEERRPHEVVAETLIANGATVAVAESLTGGRVSDLLVSVPGVSAVFKAGFATYANEAKRDVLGVPQQVLDDHGAVSEECARAMAEGARRVADADLAVATTGIAGPTGAVPGKPVGTVFIALASATETEVRRLQIVGDREQVRQRATMTALDMLRRRAISGR